jgi:hypothetical protein
MCGHVFMLGKMPWKLGGSERSCDRSTKEGQRDSELGVVCVEYDGQA